MLGTKLGIHDSIRKFEIGFRLLVSFKHVHAAAKVVVDRGCVNSVTAKALLTDLSRLEEAAKGPRRLINVIKDRT